MTNPKPSRPLLSLTIDAIFKLYFKQNPTLLRALLADFLPLPPGCLIESIEFVDAEENSLNKDFILDLKLHLRTRSGAIKIVDVEMQTSDQDNLTGRLLAYAARIYSNQIKVGEDYTQLHPVYSVVFSTINFPEFKTAKDYYHICTVQRDRPPHLAFSRGIQFVIIELAKFTKGIEKVVDQQEAWCYLLKRSGRMDARESAQLKQKGKNMEDALEVLWALSKDEAEQARLEVEEKQRMDRRAELNYARKEGRKEGQREGIEEGRKKGIKKGVRRGVEQVALKMLENGVEAKVISDCTGLSLQAIKKLIP